MKVSRLINISITKQKRQKEIQPKTKTNKISTRRELTYTMIQWWGEKGAKMKAG